MAPTTSRPPGGDYTTISDFENELEQWHTTAAATISGNSRNGAGALRINSPNKWASSYTGLSDYPKRGDVFRYWVYMIGPSFEGSFPNVSSHFYFCVNPEGISDFVFISGEPVATLGLSGQGGGGANPIVAPHYEIEIDVANRIFGDNLQLKKTTRDETDVTVAAGNVPDIQAGTYYRVTGSIGEGGTISVWVESEDGSSLLGSVEGHDTDLDSGGIGAVVRKPDPNNGNVYADFDDIQIMD